MTGKTKLEIRLVMPSTWDPSDVFPKTSVGKAGTQTLLEIGSETAVEYAGSANLRDESGLQIVNIIIHLPVAVAAHFIATWIHDKFSDAKKIALNGVELSAQIEQLKKAIQELLDASRRD